MTQGQFNRYRRLLFEHGYLAPRAKMFRFYWDDCVDLFDYPSKPRHRRLKYREDVGNWCFYERINIVHDPLPTEHVTGIEALFAFEEAIGYPMHEIMDLEILLA